MIHGLCAQIRYLSERVRADRQQLANAPLTSRQKKKLQGDIEYHKAELKRVRAKLRLIHERV